MEGMREPPVVFPKECSELTEGRRRGWGRARIGNALRRERATASLPLVMGMFWTIHILTALRAGPPFSWGVTSGGPPGGRSLSKDRTRADSAKDFCRLVGGV